MNTINAYNIKSFVNKSLIYILAAMLLMSVILTGCGKSNTELTSYKDSMDAFFVNISNYNTQINGINTTSEDAATTLLEYLDKVNEEFQTMAALTIPEEFSGLGTLPQEAAEYMQKANDEFHNAYDGEFNADSEALARQYYQASCKRMNYILQILHGEIPSGEGVTVEVEDSISLPTVGESAE